MRLLKPALITLFTFILFLPQLKAQENGKIDDMISLSLEELLNIEVISASKFEEAIGQTPAPILVISKEDILNRGYTSLPHILNDIPGFDVITANGDVTQLTYVRGNRTGSFNERTMILINGVEHNMLYTQHMAVENDFPITAIERIEILYGPASAVYGPNAFSGVINIITKSAKDIPENSSKVYSQIGGGSFDTKYGELTFLGNYGPAALSLSYRRYRSNRHDISDRPGFFANGTIIGNPDIWGPYAKYYPEYKNETEDYAFIGRLNFYNIEIGFNKFETNQGDGGVYPYDRALPTVGWKFFRDIYYLNYIKNISEKFTINFHTKYQRGGAGPDAVFANGWSGDDSGGETWSDVRSVELLTWKFISSKWNINEDFIFKPTKNWILSGGVKYASGTYQKGYEFGRSDLITFTPGDTEYDYDILFPQSPGEWLTPGNVFRDSEWGTFFQAKYSSDDKKINLVAGARYDDNNLYGDSFNPRIGATYQVHKNILLKANYGTAFQAPAPRNLYGNWEGLSVNPDLKPDEISTIDFSFIHSGNIILNDVTFFYNKVKNSIMQGENLPEKTMYGFEYKMNLLLGNNKVLKNSKIQFNYSYINAKYENVRKNIITGRSSDLIGDIAPNKFNLIFDTDIYSHIHFNARVNYVGPRITTVSNPIEKVDSFINVNTSIQVKDLLSKGLALFLNIYNLLDTEYYNPGFDSAAAGEDISVPSKGWYSSRLPQPGRNIIFGVSFDF